MNKDNEQREIKFRFYSESRGIMADFDGFHEGVGMNEMFKYCAENGIKVMQFTGLLDKNGKEIYQGDILKLKFGQVESIYEVVWDNYHAGWNLIHWKREGDEFGVFTRNIGLKEPKEVIGHIYSSEPIVK